MHTTHVVPLALVALFVGACAVTEQTTPAQVSIDSSIAKSQASALTTAVNAANAGDGVSVTHALAAVGQVAAALVPQTKNGARHALGAGATCTCTTDTSCTFDNCTIGDLSVSGTVGWGDGKLTCTSLSFTVNASAGSGNLTVDCAVAFTTGSIAGEIHTTGTAVVDGSTYTWDAKIVVNDVTFTSSALTGGSLDVNASGTVATASSEPKAYAASAAIALP